MLTLIERFNKKYVPEPNTGCWLWMEHLNKGGYGQIFYKNTLYKWMALSSHRASYAIHLGPIPKDKCVLHRCDTPACVNPDHLFLGTLRENTQDSIRKCRHKEIKKTHCPSGHEYNKENTYFRKKTRHRSCRACHRIRILSKYHADKLMTKSETMS